MQRGVSGLVPDTFLPHSKGTAIPTGLSGIGSALQGTPLWGRALPAALLGRGSCCSYRGRSRHLLRLPRGACPESEELQMPPH